MPGWSDILSELQATAQQGGPPDFDGVRRKYLAHLHGVTGRSTILYSTQWIGGGPPDASITLEDMQGMMQVCMGLPGPQLDLILHSPGGSAEATASIVRYLRRKYDHIRVFVPLAAMSAATMWALSCDEVYVGKHSQLGPIDPQIVTSQGSIPARAILDQFERAKQECSQNPAVLGAWLPILQQYGPALIEQCENAERLARRLTTEWLEQFMLAGRKDRETRAERIVRYFVDHRLHQSHALGVDRDAARKAGVVVRNLERDQRLQDAVLSVHHAALLTFSGPAVKIIENHEGVGFFKLQAQVQMQVPFPQQIPIPPPAQPFVPPQV